MLTAAALPLLLAATLLNAQSPSTHHADEDTCAGETESAVQSCLQPMLTYANQLQTDVSMQLSLKGNDIFESLCKLYTEFMSCTSTVSCRSLSVDAIQASYGYMCGEGRDLFKQYVHCFSQVEEAPSYMSCKREATTSINALSVSRDNVHKYFAELCSIMTKYLSCSHSLIVDTCGEAAWQLVAKVTQDSLRVTMPHCDLMPVFA